MLNSRYNRNYAQGRADPRYYSDSYPGYGLSNPATHTPCKGLPNVNEMTWYCMYGDPHWDADELWTTMGRLYKGGMWFKKKSVLQAEHHYDTEKTAVGSIDLRTTPLNESYNTNSSINNSSLPAADAANYFYLPALGNYSSGYLNYVGYSGSYWTSTGNPWNDFTAYCVYFDRSSARVGGSGRYGGFRVDWPD